MKLNVGWVILLALIVGIILFLFMPRRAHAAEVAPAPTVQQQLEELRDKVRDLEEIVGDPEGTVKSTEGAVKKIQKITWSGYLQGRYQSSENAIDDFFLRRARLTIGVKPSSEVSAKVSFDGAKGFELKDAFVTWIPGGVAERSPQFTLGQQNWCFGREVPVSSSVRECPERALFARSLFAGERDLGFKLTSEAGQPVLLELGVFNGTGINKRDNNQGKDIVGRLGWAAASTFDLGVSGYWGTAYVPSSERTWVKNRYGADLNWVVANGLTVKAEGVYARELGANPWGWLAQIAANLSPETVLVGRFDVYEPDGLGGSFRTETWTAGIVQHLTPNLRGKVFWESPHGGARNDQIIAEVLAVF